MIAQPTRAQINRIEHSRERAYSGLGFGPSSFACLGIGMGLGLGLSATPSGIPPNVAAIWPTQILRYIEATTTTAGTGAGISAWPALYGGSAPAQATAGSQPTVGVDATLNNMPTVTFTVAQNMTSALVLPAAGTTPTCVLTVAKVSSFAGTKYFQGDAGGNHELCAFSPSGAGYVSQSFNGGAIGGPVVLTFGTWYIFRNDFSNNAADKVGGGGIVNGWNTGSAGNNAASGLGRGLNVPTPLPITVFAELYLNVIPALADYMKFAAYINAASRCRGIVVV